MPHFKKYFKNARFLLPVTAVLVVLLVSGCGQLGAKTNKGIDLPEIYVGTEGVDAQFAPDTIPKATTEGSVHYALLIVSNKGAAGVDPKALTILARDDGAAFKFEPAVIDSGNIGIATLPGKETNPSGYLDSIKVKATANDLGGKGAETNLLATVCYPYRTNLTANVCIDTTLGTPSFQKVRKPCDAEKPLVFRSQGAPVAITKIEPRQASGDGYVVPKFKIFITNVGKGRIIDKRGIATACTDDSKNADKEKSGVVSVDIVGLKDENLKCTETEKTITETSADDYILCEYTGTDLNKDLGVFVTPLSIGLSYGYKSTSAPVHVSVEKGVIQQS
ncbi:hypothetical protein HYV83_02275 [Candidatus Woesearchaeota archaeon]|nr:hypothetical protein [Candidatus Woesearchaeota archaeon]